jgi:hypothetical protein
LPRKKITPEALLPLVRQRARDRCEYCGLPARFYPAPFQLDHIIARKHGGADDSSNLAFSCMHCNVRKGSNIAGIDRETGMVTPLFHPRNHVWGEHFEWRGAEIVGRTAIGRVTVQVLGLNEADFLTLRVALHQEGAWD